MIRFDRLLAAMALNNEAPAHATKKKLETQRAPRRSAQRQSADDASKKQGLTQSREDAK
jgi:hypothetical protein